jgi:hypothetical protein
MRASLSTSRACFPSQEELEWYGFRLVFGNRDETAVTQKIGEDKANYINAANLWSAQENAMA